MPLVCLRVITKLANEVSTPISPAIWRSDMYVCPGVSLRGWCSWLRHSAFTSHHLAMCVAIAIATCEIMLCYNEFRWILQDALYMNPASRVVSPTNKYIYRMNANFTISARDNMASDNTGVSFEKYVSGFPCNESQTTHRLPIGSSNRSCSPLLLAKRRKNSRYTLRP